ncbi:hypothetical protein CABS01_05055, partial [Colletotrichum abscissum]|uniref:uncharacterized protein n=1 Tax=Colletotrichum abscissum TaxID=1671311 RepID=UPI0027D72EEC
ASRSRTTTHSTVSLIHGRTTTQQLRHPSRGPRPEAGTIGSLIASASRLGRLVRPLFCDLLLTVPSRLGRQHCYRCLRQLRLVDNDVLQTQDARLGGARDNIIRGTLTLAVVDWRRQTTDGRPLGGKKVKVRQ